MDAFRRGMGLLTASDTNCWMHERCLTHLQLERIVANTASVQKLRERLTDADVDAYYDANLDTAR